LPTHLLKDSGNLLAGRFLFNAEFHYPRVTTSGQSITLLEWPVALFPAAGKPIFLEVSNVSIVRIGLGETKHFAEGYEAIFGKKSAAKAEKATAKKKKAKKKKKKG
jgi:hypothetical protein